MKSIIASTLLASTALAVPCAMSGPSKRSLDACAAAPNCETYEGPYGTAVRFVEGMGPGSAWYNSTVRPVDHAIQQRKIEGKLVRRQDDVNTNGEAAQDNMNFGSMTPQDVVGQMRDHCATFSCNGESWTVDPEYVTELGDTTETRTLAISTTGQWDQMVQDQNARDYFIDALVEMSGANVAVEDKDWINGGSYGAISEGTVTEHTASGYYNINRYVGGSLAGFASISITEVPNGSNICEDVTGALSTVTGAVSGIGGAFFGILGWFCS